MTRDLYAAPSAAAGPPLRLIRACPSACIRQPPSAVSCTPSGAGGSPRQPSRVLHSTCSTARVECCSRGRLSAEPPMPSLPRCRRSAPLPLTTSTGSRSGLLVRSSLGPRQRVHMASATRARPRHVPGPSVTWRQRVHVLIPVSLPTRGVDRLSSARARCPPAQARVTPAQAEQARGARAGTGPTSWSRR